MSRIIGIALLVGGVILLVYGLQADDSLASEAKELIDGSPTDEAMWMLVGGGVAAAAGVGALLMKRRG